MKFTHKMKHGSLETWTQTPEISFLKVKQVHGTDIVSPETLPTEADGLVSSWDDLTLPLGIQTADCMPIVFEGKSGVVVLHAGWRGLASGILNRAEISLIHPERAYIGPSIQKCCFEVTPDFEGNFKNSMHFMKREEKFFFDLQAEASSQIKKLYPQVEVEDSGQCTCHQLEFHSHRRDKTKNRNWNLYIKG
jgi:polyphenol oxidase